MVAPLAGVFHRMTPTPERALATVATALLAFPFFLALEGLLHRGTGVAAFAAGVLGRLLAVLALALGTLLGILPPVVNLMIAPLALVLLLAEVAAFTSHRRSRDLAAAAVMQALWLGWALAALMPMRA